MARAVCGGKSGCLLTSLALAVLASIARGTSITFQLKSKHPHADPIRVTQSVIDRAINLQADFNALRPDMSGRPHGLSRRGGAQKPEDDFYAFGSHVDMSCMLLGAIAFQMALFYLVNFPKETIQYYAYHIIGLAISIFTAVLVYDSIFDLIDYHLIEEHKLDMAILAAAIQMICWFTLMQFTAAYLSGATPWTQKVLTPSEISDADEREVAQKKWHQRKLNIKCWVGQLTHVTGFASISFWGLVQQSAFFRQNFWSAIFVVPIAFVSTILLYHGTDWIRYYIVTSGDGKFGHSHVLWDEESEDAENDVIALGLSFVTVQAFQFWFLGRLPDEEGIMVLEEEDKTLPRGRIGMDCIFLVVCAIVTAVATFLLYRLSAKLARDYHNHANIKTRLSLIAVNYSSMLFAWSLYFAVKAGVHYFAPARNTEGILARIIVALAVSASAFLLIFIMDRVADLQKRGSEVQQALAKVILAKGVLIGNSWECCFTEAFQAITFRCGRWMMLANLGLSICLCLVVIPAYWTYILPEIHSRLEAIKKNTQAEEVTLHKGWYSKSTSKLEH